MNQTEETNTARPTVSRRNQLRASGPLNAAPACSALSVRPTASLRVRLFHGDCGIAGRQAANQREGASWATTDTRSIS